MATYNEPKHIGDLLLVEVAAGWTKQRVDYAATTVVLPLGTVVTKVSGLHKPVNLAATDGNEVIHGVLGQSLPISTGTQKGITIKRGGTVAKSELVWPAGATGPQIAAGLLALEALGIVAVDAL